MIGVILARSGSKAVPDKNILEVGQRRLSHYAIYACMESSLISHTVYASDSSIYLTYAERFVAKNFSSSQNGYIAFPRSRDMSGDLTSSWESVREVLLGLGISGNTDVLLVSASCPTITSSDIACFSDALDPDNFDSALSVREVGYPIENTFQISAHGGYQPHAMSFSVAARQCALNVYRPDGHLYLRKASSIMNSDPFPVQKTQAIHLRKNIYLNIDTEQDLLYAQFIMR